MHPVLAGFLNTAHILPLPTTLTPKLTVALYCSDEQV